MHIRSCHQLQHLVSLCACSQWESASRQMVAEFMILAGEGAGRIGMPLLFELFLSLFFQFLGAHSFNLVCYSFVCPLGVRTCRALV
jgi:hypothetical protein